VVAIQSALGASRATLLRTTLLEGAFIVLLAAALALALAAASLEVVASRLPERFTAGGVNPIDLDWRSAAFMAVVASVAWIVPSVPVLLSTTRQPLVQTLQSDNRVAAASRTSMMFRGVLTVGQVSLAVVLLVGALLFARTYASLLAVERGVETANLAAISVRLPPGLFSAPAQVDDLAGDLAARLRAHPDVAAATRLLGPAPPATGFAMEARMEVDGRSAGDADLTAVIYDVEPAFFETLGLPALAGRTFDPTDPPTSAVISESMARQFWPGQNPVGRTFQFSRSYPLYSVVGVVPHVRNNRDDLAGPNDAFFVFYRPAPARVPASGRLQRGVSPGDTPVNVPAAARGMQLTFLARLTDARRLAAVAQVARDAGGRGVRVQAELVDEQYARRHADTLMAAEIVTAFGVLAVAVTVAGVYAVMAFLVAGRTREIGIRMALGATRRAVHRLVFGSSLRWVGAGAAVGIGGAALASQWIESQLFGVSTVDPSTYLGVTGLILLMAVLATWLPARRAARVDPALTLRAE
jgi:predicted permease